MLSRDKILAELDFWSILWFMSEIFKQYLKDNLSLLKATSLQYSIQCISGELHITNQTYITNQPYFINSYLSTVSIDNSTIYDITSDNSILSLTDTVVTMSNIEAYDLHTTSLGGFIQLSFDSTANLNNINYTNSTTKFVKSLSSQLQITNLMSTNISLTQYLIDSTDCSGVTLQNIVIYNINKTKGYLMYATRSSINQIVNMTIYDINVAVLHCLKSNITIINDLLIHDVTDGIHFQQSSIGMFENSRIYRSGSTSILQGGALLIENSNSTIQNMTFMFNAAQSGGAISIDCNNYDIWQNIINNSIFSNNMASVQGGAIFYNYRRPDMPKIEFTNNTASYGPNIGSYPVRIVNSVMMDDPIVLTNVASGMVYNETLRLLLVDYDGQTMNLISDSRIKVLPMTNGASLIGVDYSVLVNGQANFDSLQFTYGPGQDNIQFLATCDLIDSNKVSYLSLPTSDSIDVTFRYCQPGEIVQNNQTCFEWSAGTYSFTWNSTECKSCMDNAVWLGGSKVYVLNEHWRLDGNSTDIQLWPRPHSCKGGYHPNLDHTVEWETGYRGHLWARWDIIDGSKYQRISTYRCAKCPNPILNGIIVVFVIFIAFAFLLVLTITTIRKKKEDQVSILLRIMTNYLQLISAAYSFNLKFPDGFLEIFGSIEIIGASSDSFLSFDCFVKDSEIKFLVPSTEIFKAFLTIFLPIVLIVIFVLIWVILYLINSKVFRNLKRNIIISVICTLFLLHPNVTKQALSLFECISVGDNDMRMRTNMDYDWYSTDHIKWIAIVGSPSLIIWVIATPIFAFVILYKNRNRLEEESIKKYYSILYQGLTRKVFYWEFINTIKKVVIISVNTILSVISVIYRLLLCIILLVIVERLQQRLKPYKLEKNNDIEIKAIIAGTTVLFLGLIFEESAEDNHPEFNTVGLIIVVIYNSVFLLQWTYLFLYSLNFKNENLKKALEIYRCIICFRKSKKLKLNQNYQHKQ